MGEKQRIVLFLAFVCAATAALLAKKQIMEIAWQAKSIAEKSTTVVKEVQVNTTTMVVANRDLPYGTTLTRADLKEVDWPSDTVPPGTFRSIDEIFIVDLKRSVLRQAQKDEPIRAADITGPDQRASLSSLLEEGKMAVSIPVNDVMGVAGFVLPGDTVDIMFTRKHIQTDNGRQNRQPVTTVMLHGVRVLGIDQIIDDRLDKPKRVKTITVEVSPVDAQRISLARTAGDLSLALRRYGEKSKARGFRKMTIADLETPSKRFDQLTDQAKISPVSSDGVDQAAPSLELSGSKESVSVIRDADKPVEYSVPRGAKN